MLFQEVSQERKSPKKCENVDLWLFIPNYNVSKHTQIHDSTLKITQPMDKHS
jgi:hypothetical protein